MNYSIFFFLKNKKVFIHKIVELSLRTLIRGGWIFKKLGQNTASQRPNTLSVESRMGFQLHTDKTPFEQKAVLDFHIPARYQTDYYNRDTFKK
jgi:hypothetical protein